MESKLSDFLNSGKDWEKKATSIPGIFVMKMPPFRNMPDRLAVELNPVNSEGRPTRKRGIIINSFEELNNFKTILNDEKLINLLRNIDSINPKMMKREDIREDVIEI